jgi:hypothetical protein
MSNALAEALSALCEAYCSASWTHDWEFVVYRALMGDGVLHFGRDTPPKLNVHQQETLRMLLNEARGWPVFSSDDAPGRDPNTCTILLALPRWEELYVVWYSKAIWDVLIKIKTLPAIYGIAYAQGVLLLAAEGADDRFQEVSFSGLRVRLISYLHFKTLANKIWEAGPAVPKRRSQEDALHALHALLPDGARIVSVTADEVTYELTLQKPLASVHVHVPDDSKESTGD